MRLSRLLLVLGLLVIGLVSASQRALEPGPPNRSEPVSDTSEQQVDDWVYSGLNTDDGRPSLTPNSKVRTPSTMAQDAGSGQLGYSVGGANDVANFRANVANGYLPLPTDLTHEGLFRDYYFDTGKQTTCQHLLCPSYSYAVSRDPLSGNPEPYLTVGLNAGLSEVDVERTKLNLVVVLDISGSMRSAFDRYYYDRFRGQRDAPSSDAAAKSKIALATESVASLMDHLRADDRFGMVLFNDSAHLAKPLARVGDTDMAAIRDHVLELHAGGSTNMSAGLETGTDLFDEAGNVDPSQRENRIIFLTDAMPNRGETDDDALLDIAERNADRGIHSTFIGVGVDFNTKLVESLSKIRGANYHAVHSAERFRDRMDEGFAYMVTPLAFDLELTLEAPGYRIAHVYGTPNADTATGRLMSISTLFPSRTRNGKTRGGVVLLKLERQPSDERAADPQNLVLRVRYEDREGRDEQVETAIPLPDREPNFYDNSGIRKAILLARYGDVLQNWLIDEHRRHEADEPIEPSLDREIGIRPPELEPSLGRWERQSTPLSVSAPYRELLSTLRAHMQQEMANLDDDTLQQELELLAELTSVE